MRPLRTIVSVEARVSSIVPSSVVILAVPERAGRRPDSARSVVDLPAPFAPISATSSPLATSNETSFSTWVAPRNTFSSLTWRMGASGMGGPLSSRAQIGFDYGRISLHFGGRSLADEFSTIEYLDAAA